MKSLPYKIHLKLKIQFCLILVVASLCVNTAFGQVTPIEELERQIRSQNQEVQRLENERSDALGTIGRFKEREVRVLELLRMLAENIKSTETKLAGITEDITNTREEIVRTNAAIEDLKVQIERDKVKINKQINALFYLGKVRSMTHFIGADSFKNYYRNQKLLTYSTQIDLELLDRYNRNLAENHTAHEDLKRQTGRLEQLGLQEKEQQSVLEFERKQQVTYLQHLRDDRSSQIKYLREIQVELERVNDTLYSLELRKEDTLRAKTFQGIGDLKNRLPRPVNGVLVHRFEQEQSPYYTLFRRGVLVETSKNAEVRSIYAGKVAWSGPFRGYQNLVILDHGKGSFSVYGNLEDVYIFVDDVVNQGDLLGTVAQDDVEQKYLFYFEIRYNKTADDPLIWLKKPVWNP